MGALQDGCPRTSAKFPSADAGHRRGGTSPDSRLDGPPSRTPGPVQNTIQLSMIVTTPRARRPSPSGTRRCPRAAHRRGRAAAIARTTVPGKCARMLAKHTPDPDGGGERAGDVLALAADVEQAAAERERDGQAGEHQGRRQHQRLLERIGVTRLEAVGVPREPDRRVRERHDDVVATRVEEPAQAAPVEDRLVRRRAGPGRW